MRPSSYPNKLPSVSTSCLVLGADSPIDESKVQCRKPSHTSESAGARLGLPTDTPFSSSIQFLEPRRGLGRIKQNRT
jgi:hypothetical protein